jgi:hypothetical protein
MMTDEKFQEWLLGVLQRELESEDSVRHYAEIRRSFLPHDRTSHIEVQLGTDRFIIKIKNFADVAAGWG